jgi:hypothetical protein
MRILVDILFNEEINSRQVYQLAEDIEFNGWEHTIVVKKGFKTDLVSIPLPLSLFAPPTGLWAYASIFHDFLYKTHLTTQKEADEIFYKIMKDTGVKPYKRLLAYYAVRLFGWYGYNKHFSEKDIRYGYVKSIEKGHNN